ncbi:MAG: TetR/AcrR family transcriptional regulator [Chitinophagales bacterium]|nr:TetR/AcrR family transcriptional regulator [Chitinophagales bacterium]
MNLQISIQPNLKLALRDPEASTLGRKIIREGIVLMCNLGYEQFTFKKLAESIDSTEASIYRYFENKHRLLLYFLTWYWNYVEYQCTVSLHNLNDPEIKIRKIIEILTGGLPNWADTTGIDKSALQDIVIAESSKAYLTKEVDAINSQQLFKPYKDLCHHIATVFAEYNPAYPYPHSLASTLMEAAQFQPYFMEHLPALTDFKGEQRNKTAVAGYLENLVFAALRK